MKQETLEEASEYFAHNNFNMHDTNNYKALKTGFEKGAQWQAERSYSEEEMCLLIAEYQEYLKRTFHPEFSQATFKQWFEQFKNK